MLYLNPTTQGVTMTPAQETLARAEAARNGYLHAHPAAHVVWPDVPVAKP